ncbi:MAG: hypothetical protein C0501_22105 [Isosphaera sp.]|nr:hypothetical protein [Isosphaera sp.]
MVRFVLLVPLAAGCATHADRLAEVRSAYHAGNAPEARARLDAALARNDRDADVLKLDKATALLTEGRPKEAEALFREVRDKFEEKEGRDLREAALAAVTDDQRLAYPGEDHEKVLLRFYLALCSLMQDGSDATAYALQVNQKQQQIIDTARKGAEGAGPKDGYKLVAAGAYLYAALREATHADYDDAARSFEQVAKWQPDFAPAKADLERVKTGRHSQPGHGAVYVFAMVGRGPYKEERAEVVTQAALLVADRILSAVGKHTLPPTLAPVKVPVVARPVNQVASVGVYPGGKSQTRYTETLTDVGLMASEQAKAVLPEVLARAVVRRVVKKGVVYGAKEAAGADKNGLASIALDVAGVAWEATEAADTRCWGLLPDKIQVLRLELPAGEHRLTLQPAGANGSPLGAPEEVLVTVADGRNTYVLATYPGAKPVGKAVVSRP